MEKASKNDSESESIERAKFLFIDRFFNSANSAISTIQRCTRRLFYFEIIAFGQMSYFEADQLTNQPMF